MASNASGPSLTLVYGNQRHSVEETAERLIVRALGDAPREFTFHRFDAAELLAPGAADAVRQGIDEFQIACQTVPFLSEAFLVRLDHLERVKLPGRAALNITSALEALRVGRVTWEDRPVWAAAEDLPADEAPREQSPVIRWVKAVSPLAGGAALLELEDPAPEFLLSRDGAHRVLGLKAYLGEKLKGRLVFSDDAPEAGQERESASAAGRLHQLLEKFIANPPPGCILLLTASAARESEFSAPLLKLIKRHGRIEKFVTYDDYQPVDWVLKEARARGLGLSRSAAERVIQLVGNDLGRLAGELDKLALLFAHDPAQGPALDEASLLAALRAHGRYSLFAITERLGDKDLEGALSVLQQFLVESPNEHPIMTGILARYFRQLYHVHALRQQGTGEQGLPAALKLPPFVARKLAAQAGRYSTRELEGILSGLGRLDVALRGGHQAGVLYKDFLLGICEGRFAKRVRPLQYVYKAGII